MKKNIIKILRKLYKKQITNKLKSYKKPFVVTNDIPKYAMAGGHPAKVFKYRDIEHYEKLKKEGKFH